MIRPALLLAAVLVVASGCSSSRSLSDRTGDTVEVVGTGGSAVTPSEREVEIAALSDVTLDGTSLLGAWYAVEVVGDRRATRDLEDGTLEKTLLINPNGRAILTGVDRREGSGDATFSGQIDGNRITFVGMDGAGTLSMSGRRLLLRDPNGRSTVYVRGE